MREGDEFGKWTVEKRLGGGGQGEVGLVKIRASSVSSVHFMNAIRKCADYTHESTRLEGANQLFNDLRTIVFEAGQEASSRAALKVLRDPTEKALERMRREIAAASTINDPALIRIVEANIEGHWFVMDYFERGTLTGHLGRHRGDALNSLLALRPIVAALARLHQAGYVHRDVKPDNIFVTDNDSLVLGDFGLVIHNPTENERVTDTLENVGSRDWMPMWASGVRIDEIAPSFDVFSLGKVLWSIVSGRPFLRAWYFKDSEFDLEKMFPRQTEIRWITRILERSVVEREANCLKSATDLLTLVDESIEALSSGGQVLRKNDLAIRCLACSIGRCYGTFPLNAETMQLTCSNCGYIHRFDRAKDRAAWQ